MMEWKREEGAPAWNTWPSAHNAEGWNLRNKQRLKANIELVIKFKRRERWQKLKAELGQEYLEQIKTKGMRGGLLIVGYFSPLPAARTGV
jgi:hypothetical protein